MVSYKVFEGEPSKYDTYFLAVKNTLKDYFRIANTIPYLSGEEKTDASGIVAKIDTFINTDLLDNVKRFMEKDMAEYNNKYNTNEVSLKDEGGKQHKILFAKYFHLMDYQTFLSAERDTELKFYKDISRMDTIDNPSEVKKRLLDIQNKINLLANCNDLQDLGNNEKVGEFNFLHGLNNVLSSCAVSKMALTGYDEQPGHDGVPGMIYAKITVTPRDEQQAKAMMRFFERNWELSADSFHFQNNICYINGHSGMPSIDLYVKKPIADPTKNFEPYKIYIAPTPDCLSYFTMVPRNITAPKELYERFNTLFTLFDEQSRKTNASQDYTNSPQVNNQQKNNTPNGVDKKTHRFNGRNEY